MPEPAEVADLAPGQTFPPEMGFIPVNESAPPPPVED